MGIMTLRELVVVALAVVCWPVIACGQTNFFNRGGVALYEPVVDTVNSGARLVATPTVSADLKYVTIAARPEVSQLVALPSFPVAILGTANGNVGQVAPQQQRANGPADANGGRPGPVQQVREGNNLSRQGMILIAPLE